MPPLAVRDAGPRGEHAEEAVAWRSVDDGLEVGQNILVELAERRLVLVRAEHVARAGRELLLPIDPSEVGPKVRPGLVLRDALRDHRADRGEQRLDARGGEGLAQDDEPGRSGD